MNAINRGAAYKFLTKPWGPRIIMEADFPEVRVEALLALQFYLASFRTTP